jgi:hypothetical protein
LGCQHHGHQSTNLSVNLSICCMTQNYFLYFIIGRGWLLCILTKCQPRSRIHLSSQVVAYIYFGKSDSIRRCTWIIIFISDLTTEWNGGIPFFREFFNVRINLTLDKFDVNVSNMIDINIVPCIWQVL